MLLPSSSQTQGAETQMLRSVLAELFPNWVKRHAIRSTSSGKISALASLQTKIKMADKQKPVVKNPEAPGQRSAKADPDRKDTAGSPKTPKTSGAPVRDVREDPASNPNGDPKGKGTPLPTDKPVTGA